MMDGPKLLEQAARAICIANGYEPDGQHTDTLPENESMDGWKTGSALKLTLDMPSRPPSPTYPRNPVRGWRRRLRMDKPNPDIVLSMAAELILAEMYLAGKTGRDITVAEAASIICMKTDFPPDEWTEGRLNEIERELVDNGMIEESEADQ